MAVGLYLDPPDKALVLSRRREEPDPGARPHTARLADQEGRPAQTHDYKLPRRTSGSPARRRHRQARGHCMKRHRHQEWLKFLAVRRRDAGKKLDLHLIADNYATHKHPKVGVVGKTSLASICSTPTSASWLSQVERFSADHQRSNPLRRVQERRRTRNSHSGIPRAPQCRPKRFVASATAIEKVARGRQALESVH